jgi:hypothetical protein
MAKLVLGEGVCCNQAPILHVSPRHSDVPFPIAEAIAKIN